MLLNNYICYLSLSIISPLLTLTTFLSPTTPPDAYAFACLTVAKKLTIEAARVTAPTTISCQLFAVDTSLYSAPAAAAICAAAARTLNALPKLVTFPARSSIAEPN